MTQPDLALYVHFPWCVRKCPYCDFNSHPVREGGFDESAYVDGLLIDLDSQLATLETRPAITSVFCGGGTPSLFSAAAIGRLLDRLTPLLAAGAEITLEANPGTTEHHDFGGYLSAGINRLSFGVQSFDDAKLKAIGRIHDGAAVYRSFELARKAGFQNINLDLMYGLPRQTRTEAIFDLESAIALGPEHLSWYQLTLEPKTEFARRPPQLPGDIIMEAIELCGYDALATAGFERYEISAFARSGSYCRHNLQYWSFGDYLGIGAGAHGKLSKALPGGAIRTRKPHQPRVYLSDPETTISEVIPPTELAGEFMMNALRLRQGVTVDRFEEATGLSATELEPQRSAQIAAGLLEPDRLTTTPRGYALLDSLIQDYI